MDLIQTRDDLAERLITTAHWRQEKSDAYPNDDRNILASERLILLESGVADIPDELVRSYIDLWAEGETFALSEIESQAFRDVGFWSFPTSATEFLRELVGSLRASV